MNVLAKGIAVGAGLLMAAYAEYFAVVFAISGWTEPYWCTPILFIAYPVAILRLLDRNDSTVSIDKIALVTAIVLDIYLCVGTYVHEDGHFSYIMTFMESYIWVALWIFWQLLIVWSIFARLHHRDVATGRQSQKPCCGGDK